MYTERLKVALAILILCCAAALKLTFPEEAENIKQKGTELFGSGNAYRQYVIRIGTQLSEKNVGEGVTRTFALLEDRLCSLSEQEP